MTKETFEQIREKHPLLLALINKTEQIYTTFPKSACEMIELRERDIFGSDLIMYGAITRTQNLLGAVIREMVYGNHYAIRTLLRGQMETVALLHYIAKHPDYVKRALIAKGSPKASSGPINVLTMIDDLDKELKKQYKNINFREDYDIFSDIVHPNSPSLLAPFTRVGNDTRMFRGSTVFEIKNEEIEQYLNSSMFLYDKTLEYLGKLRKIFPVGDFEN